MTSMKDTWDISRRTLLKSAGAGALALGLAGCSSGSTDGSASGSSGETAAASVTENEAETVTCTSEYVGAAEDVVKEWTEATVYDVDAQAAIVENLESQKDGQTLAAPLVVYNPFGTNSQSLYVYFTTEDAATVEYTVSISDEAFATIDDETLTADSIADFTRSVNGGESATEFEFSLYGLIPNTENTVTITATYESGDVETTTFACEMCDILGTEELQLVVTDGESDAELTDGLYTVMGLEHSEGTEFVYFYDNDGILRGELPLIDGRVQRMLFEDDLVYISASNTEIVAMNELGQVVKDYPLNEGDEKQYRIHHDYVSDGDNYLIILGTDNYSDTIEDLIYFLNKETGVIDYTLDLGNVFTSYKEQAVAYHQELVAQDSENYDGETGIDWIHVNTVQWLGDDTIILSCREISSIVKISNVFDGPTIDYILSSQEYWEGTEYEDLVYEQVGDFTVQGGQHTVTYVEDDSLEDGQYYLYMYNNNLGLSSAETSDFDYASVGLTNNSAAGGDDSYSYYYRYLVDENEGTFELVESIEVPYSAFLSSAQEIGDNVITGSGIAGQFAEYDEDGELIRSFDIEVETYFYRVFKYDL